MKRSARFYVYILACADGSLYTGYTNDLEKRVALHNAGRASKCTRARLPVRLVYAAPCRSRSDALKEEARIKALSRTEKKTLVARHEKIQEKMTMMKKSKGLMKELPLNRVFQYVEPGPVALVTTADKGKYNVMTLSWHMCLEFVPPLIGCCIGDWDYSFKALRNTGECVFCVPGVDMAGKVVDIGSCSGKDVDKFARFQLTPQKAKKVKAPLIAECLANFECKVENTTLSNRYGFIILKVVHAWIDCGRKERRTFHANGDGTFIVDGRTIDLRKRMLKRPDWL